MERAMREGVAVHDEERLHASDSSSFVIAILSRSVASYLEREGFGNVVNLSGGVAAWARDVDPGMPVY